MFTGRLISAFPRASLQLEIVDALVMRCLSQIFQGPRSRISAAMVHFEEATASPDTLDVVVGLLTIYVSMQLKMGDLNPCYDTKELC